MTADAAGQARELGALITELQRERLLTAAYLASAAGQSDVERQQRTVDDTAESLRSRLGSDASEELSAALVRLGSLVEIRQNAANRGVSLDSVARTYHAVTDALIDALRLVPQQTSDAEGTRQLTALEALLRANEQHTLRGMALIVAASSPETGAVLLDDATAQAQIFTVRFVQQADPEHAGRVVEVERGEEGRQVEELAGRAVEPRNPSETANYISDAYASVDAQSKLRSIVQDQVTTEIADAAAGRAADARTVAWAVGGGAALLFALVAFLAVAVSRSIANPMRRLTAGATEVAELADKELIRVTDTEVPDEQVPRLAAIEVSSRDELGELAAAFNRVQHTAAKLVERQALTRHNVSQMFANVAQRTQNLVGRQLSLVDELERNEQDTRLLESLYRLDHLSTRLRRTADNLLVVAGTRDETKLGGPTELATALRSALAEIEDYQRVQLGEISEIVLATSLGSDLVLVFAELLENATSFSPPEADVEVRSGFLTDGSCLVSVIDHGIGMPPERLAEENRRLVARERLDIAPTSMLGLFVVGRLARRHFLTVQLVATEAGGVTAHVVIPAARFSRATAPQPAIQAEAPVRRGLPAGMQNFEIPPAEFTPGFTWFPDHAAIGTVRRRVPVGVSASAQQPPQPPPQPPPPAQPPMPARQPAQQPAQQPARAAGGPPGGEGDRGGLRRRVAGAQLPGAGGRLAQPAAAQPTAAQPVQQRQHDPAAARGAMDGFQSAIAKASQELPVLPPAGQTTADGKRGGLTRRQPGKSMAPGLRKPEVGRPPARVSNNWRQRDPDVDRANFDGFAAGISRASMPPANVWPTSGRDNERPKGTN